MSPAYATPFADRASAGRLLAVELAKLQSDRPIVHALPRGGVAVAVPIAVAKDRDRRARCRRPTTLTIYVNT